MKRNCKPLVGRNPRELASSVLGQLIPLAIPSYVEQMHLSLITVSYVHVFAYFYKMFLSWLTVRKQRKIQLNIKKTKSMKKNREIDFAEPLMGDNYHSLEVSSAKDSLADKAKRKARCAAHWLL